MDPAIRRESVTALVAEGMRAISLNWLALSLAMLSLVPIARGPAMVVVVVLAVLAFLTALAYGSVEPAVPGLTDRDRLETSGEPSSSQVGQVLEEAWLLQDSASPLAAGALVIGVGALVWSVLATPDLPTERLVGVLVGSGLLLLCGVRVARARYGLRRHGPRPRTRRERVAVVIGGRRLLRLEGELWRLRQQHLPEIRALAAEAQTWLERAVEADGPQRRAAVQAAMAAQVRQVPKAKADDYARNGIDDIRPMIKRSTKEIRPSLVAPLAALVTIGQTLTLTRLDQRRQLRLVRARQPLADQDPPSVSEHVVDKIVAELEAPGTRTSRLSAASDTLENWKSVGVPPQRIVLPGDG